MSILKKILGDPNKQALKNIQVLVDKVNAFESDIKKLNDQELKSKTELFRKLLRESKSLDDILPEAFAVVREAAGRVLGIRHFDVQLIGGVALHRGSIAEMRTGEGKTLAATLPLYLNALTKRGCHLVTPNDYLSRVGGGWMGPLYESLGISVGVITHDSAGIYDSTYSSEDSHGDKRLDHWRPVTRQEAYAADITYGTNNEFGFDYLRDNMAAKVEDRVQRDLHYAIVDEVDSILIDEARTPLIISAPAEESNQRYYRYADIIRTLNAETDYNVDEKMRAATLTEEGITKIEKILGVDNLYSGSGISTVHHVEQALRAEVLYKNDRDYVIKDGEIVIVDEFTGRLMFGRRYSEGLHQAIEAKEKVAIQRESQTLATVTFQNYFRLYEKLAGMTGTAETEAEEFHKIYNLDVIVVPTNKQIVRVDHADRIYKTEKGKFDAVIKEVKELHDKGQPVLIGTISIQKNERLSELLDIAGIPHEVLNAKNHEREAAIIANAGKRGAITLATNMAGRGVDVILGGSLPDKNVKINYPEEKAKWEEEHKQVLELGGLHVVGTERHESRRIDNQLRGRAGRQGDAGSSQFYVSLEDDLMRVFSSDRVRNMMERLGVPEDMPIENKMVSKALETAQRRVEGHNFDIRKHLVEYDDVINKHRETIYRLRRRALDGYLESLESGNDLLTGKILEMVEQEIESVIAYHTHIHSGGDWDVNEITEVLRTIYPVSGAVEQDVLTFKNTTDDAQLGAKNRTQLIEKIIKDAEANYEALRQKVIGQTGNDKSFLDIERSLMIRAIDSLWVEHLEAMDHLRQGIGLRGYGQRDPLVEYKKEAYKLFNELLDLIRKQIVYSIFKVSVVMDSTSSLMERQNVTFSAPAKTMSENGSQDMVGKNNQNKPVQKSNKVGRNEPCPCGATKSDGKPKKYKHCHGQS